jgi:predicted nucleotidyltransferase
MRLNSTEQQTLKEAAQSSFGQDVVLRLFGSRLNDQRKGGDIDLLVTTTLTDAAQISQAHIRFLSDVYARLGEQKIDLLIDYPGRQQHFPIFDIAVKEGVIL